MPERTFSHHTKYFLTQMSMSVESHNGAIALPVFRFWIGETLKCLIFGTLKTINFPFVLNEKLMVLSVLIFKNVIRL